LLLPIYPLPVTAVLHRGNARANKVASTPGHGAGRDGHGLLIGSGSLQHSCLHSQLSAVEL